MDYTLLVHRHRFAAWAAARAAQRKLKGASVGALIRALEFAGFPGVVDATVREIASAKQFDEFHRATCGDIIEFLGRSGVEATYGRAAKLVAVYLKSMIVLGPCMNWAVAALIHPPIDRVLLKSIANDTDVPHTLRRVCDATAWTNLNEREYFDLIRAFRDCGLDRPEFWALERHWDVNADD